MAKILLIQPPIYRSEYTARGSKHTISILPPMGLAYIAAYLIRHGHDCEIMDGMAVPFDMSVLPGKAPSFDIIGITSVSTFAKRVYEIVNVLKTGKVNAPVVIGGPHATALPENCLRAGADYVVIGEGEITMLELVNALIAGRNVTNIPGIAFLEDNQYYRTPKRSLIESLDDIPLPARNLLPMDKYRCSEARTRNQPSHSLFTSRGCPGACTFCNKSIFGSRVRYYSVSRIVEEFFLLRDIYGAKDIAVWDDNFFSDPKIAHAVCDELIKNKFNRTWSIEARIDSVDKDILVHAKEAGCDFIAYGIESGSQKVLDAMNKKITLEQIEHAVKITKEVGINTRGYFMMGMPNETVEDMEKTISFAKKLNIDVASFTLFVPLPGTVEYRRALKTGIFVDPEYFLHNVYPEFNFPDRPLYIPEGITANKLLKIHRSAYNKFYFRIPFLLRSIFSIRSASDVSRNIKGFLNILSNAITKTSR